MRSKTLKTFNSEKYLVQCNNNLNLNDPETRRSNKNLILYNPASLQIVADFVISGETWLKTYSLVDIPVMVIMVD